MTDNNGGDEYVDTIVVGAGPSGLAMGACLAKAGVPYTVLERNASVGSAWRNHYERLHLHTVKQHSALPYMPFPDQFPRYPSRQNVVDYLDAYSRTFGIAPRFNQEVRSVRRADGFWETLTEDCRFKSANVVVASGYNRTPNIPAWPGQGAFQGQVIHSSQYRNGEPYRGKRVLIVGMGNTGGEIAIDLHEHCAARLHICVRSPANVLPREIMGTPCQISAIALSHFPDFITDGVGNMLARIFVGDLSKYGLVKPSISPAAQINKLGRIPLIDIGTIALVKQGRIKVEPQIDRFTETGARFVNGDECDFHAVILATGFKAALEEFVEGAAELVDERGYPVPSAGESKWKGLFFLGFASPATGLLRQIGIDARQIARQIVARRAGPVFTK